jgi:hypothetical protein
LRRFPERQGAARTWGGIEPPRFLGYTMVAMTLNR